MTNPNINIYLLLTILLNYAPNAEAQSKCTEYYNKVVSDSAAYTTKQKEIELASALLNGLRFGNWPWTDYKATCQHCHSLNCEHKDDIPL